jgi:hypothetical protein
MNQRVEQFSLLISLVDVKHLIKAKKKLFSSKTRISIFTKRNYFNIESTNNKDLAFLTK